MKNYTNINNCFNCFDKRAQTSLEDYLSFLVEYLINNEVNLVNTRKEILLAINEKIFNWKKIADDNCFIYSNENSTNEDILFAFKLLAWKIIFFEEDSKIDFSVYEKNRKFIQNRILVERKIGFGNIAIFDSLLDLEEDVRYEIIRSFQKFGSIRVSLKKDGALGFVFLIKSLFD